MGTYVRTQTVEHPIGERGRVTIKVTEGDVRVQGIAGPDARMRITFDIRAASDAEADDIFEAVKLEVEAGPGLLKIEERDGRPSIGKALSRLFSSIGYTDLAIEAFLPAGVELHLAGVSSDVETSGMRGDQRYATVSGDLMLTDLGGSVRLNAVSGDATLRATEAVSVSAEAVSGDLAITAPRLESLRASSVSGDIELETELVSGGDYRVNTVSGDFVVGLRGSATFEIRGLSTDVHSEIDHRLEGRSDRRRLIIGQGGPLVVFSSMSGDVDVRRPRDLAPYPHAAQQATESVPAPEAQMEILRLLERGEIDVDEATRRLAAGNPDA